MFNYRIYSTALYVNNVNPQITKINLFNFFNTTLSLNSTLSLYAKFPCNLTITPLGCTVHLNCTVLHLCCVHKYSTHTYTHNTTLQSPVIHVTFTNNHLAVHTLIITPIYAHVFKRYCLLIIFTYLV